MIVFGGMAHDAVGYTILLPDMFELSISQRWWRQARPHLLLPLPSAPCRHPDSTPLLEQHTVSVSTLSTVPWICPCCKRNMQRAAYTGVPRT